ncbi:alpha/beta hydrolase [Phenylobacterium sp.]|uniref:alpha/beta hydrolase n=1 Tax=Phenylobacterium sp. TaxID=1871053 RepID=UPI003569E5E7
MSNSIGAIPAAGEKPPSADVADQPASPPELQPDPARVVRQVLASEYQPPAGVAFRTVTIISDGIRLHGEVFTPSAAEPAHKLPGVVMAHGWGGVAASFRADAADIARAGYLVLVFDYRGWGESGSPVVLLAPEPLHVLGEAAPFTARVQPLREYVNPLEQAEDWFSALDWMMGEPQIDTGRIGIRGSSYSGGHVVHVAAHDPRVRAVVSQVGGFDSRPAAGMEQPGRDAATRMARGELGYPAPRASAILGLIGSPIGHKGERYAPVLDAAQVIAPTLIVLVENEEYGGNPTAEAAYASLQGPKELRVLPGVTHYAVYSTERATVVKLAIEWFDRFLKTE